MQHFRGQAIALAVDGPDLDIVGRARSQTGETVNQGRGASCHPRR